MKGNKQFSVIFWGIFIFWIFLYFLAFFNKQTEM